MAKTVELLPVTYDPEKLHVWADENFRRIVDAIASLKAADIGVGQVPIGGVTLWWGTAASVPTGWAICDGTNGTPDLRGRVPVGVDTGQTEFDVLGETGGTKTNTIASGNLPVHTHTVDHDHGSSNSGGQSDNHSHQGRTTNQDGGGPAPSPYNDQGYPGSNNHSGFRTTDRTGALLASGTIGGTCQIGNRDAYQDHVHAVDLPNFTGSSGNGGFAGTALNNLQPYLALHFIMRVS